MSDDRPLVSAVLIFWNAERFLAEAVESVFAQTYAHWELLLVDDGSSDGSTAIAQSFVRRDRARVRYLEHEHHVNRGMSAARNLGLRHARGTFIASLDADDVWSPQKLEQQVALLAANPRAQMVCGRSLYWSSWATPDAKDTLSESCGPANAIAEPPTLLRRWFAGRRTIPSPSSIMFRTEMARRIGGYEESFRGLFEDLAFMIKVFHREPVFVTDECWDRHRHHPDSCVGRASEHEWNDAWRTFLLWLERYLADNDMRQSELWPMLQTQLWPFRHPVLFRLSRLGRR